MSHATQQVTARSYPVSRNTAAFGKINEETAPDSVSPPDFTAIAHSPEFRALQRRLLWFIFPMSATFLLWYMTYVVVAAWMPEFMAIRIFGEINVGLLMGVGQFVSTIAITIWYQRFAAQNIDPRVAELRRAAMGGEVE